MVEEEVGDESRLRGRVLAILLVLAILGGVTTAMANFREANTCLDCGAGAAKNPEIQWLVNSSNTLLKAPEELTKEDLQKLYRKYNITENDIKFAEGKLPHYLEGTILSGKVATMGKVTKEGKIEDWIDPLFYNWCVKNSYKVIPAAKALEIEEKARKDYIRKYGVNPANPKVVIVNEIPLPKEYVRDLILSGKLTPEYTTLAVEDRCDPDASSRTGPWAVNDKLYLWIVEAKGDQKPVEAYLQDTVNAYARFYQFSPGTLYYYHLQDYWDASDVTPWDNSSKLLRDLAKDTGGLRDDYNDRDPTNDIVIGWVKFADHNGRADCNGFFSVAATSTYVWTWPHDSIAQHEISHNFNAGEGGTWPWENGYTECIMNYWYAFWGTDKWCTTHWNVVNGNINGYWE